MLMDHQGREYSPRLAAQQKAMLDKLAEDLEEMREHMTLQVTIPQRNLIEFFRRLEYTKEDVRRLRNRITTGGDLK